MSRPHVTPAGIHDPVAIRPSDPFTLRRARAMRHRRGRDALGGLALLAAAFLGLKAALIVVAGPADYDRRVALLAEGTALDRAAARAFGRDPVSQAGADLLRDLMR